MVFWNEPLRTPRYIASVEKIVRTLFEKSDKADQASIVRAVEAELTKRKLQLSLAEKSEWVYDRICTLVRDASIARQNAEIFRQHKFHECAMERAYFEADTLRVAIREAIYSAPTLLKNNDLVLRVYDSLKPYKFATDEETIKFHIRTVLRSMGRLEDEKKPEPCVPEHLVPDVPKCEPEPLELTKKYFLYLQTSRY